MWDDNANGKKQGGWFASWGNDRLIGIPAVLAHVDQDAWEVVGVVPLNARSVVPGGMGLTGGFDVSHFMFILKKPA